MEENSRQWRLFEMERGLNVELEVSGLYSSGGDDEEGGFHLISTSQRSFSSCLNFFIELYIFILILLQII